MLPVLAAEGLVDAVDAFCEHLAFSPAQVERVFQSAAHLGLPVSCMPSSYPHCTAPRWRRAMARCRPITSNT